jgi:hypothetical protein
MAVDLEAGDLAGSGHASLIAAGARVIEMRRGGGRGQAGHRQAPERGLQHSCPHGSLQVASAEGGAIGPLSTPRARPLAADTPEASEAEQARRTSLEPRGEEA